MRTIGLDWGPGDANAAIKVDRTVPATPMVSLGKAVVALYKEAFGRGPEKARAQYAGPDVVVIVLERTLTVAERNLWALGQEDRLRELRVVTRRVFEDELRALVERILGRRAIASMSAIDPQRDVAAEVLTLEPQARCPSV